MTVPTNTPGTGMVERGRGKLFNSASGSLPISPQAFAPKDHFSDPVWRAISNHIDLAFGRGIPFKDFGLSPEDNTHFGLGIKAFDALSAAAKLRVFEKSGLERRYLLRVLVQDLAKELDGKAAEYDAEIRSRRARIAELKREAEIWDGVENWISAAPKLEAPKQPLFYRLLDAFNGSRVYGCAEEPGAPKATNTMPSDTKSFLICHDWNGAIGGSIPDGGPIKLPSDACAFEMQLGGRRLIYFIEAEDGDAFRTDIFVSLQENYWVSLSGGNLNADLSPVTPHPPEKQIAALEIARAQIRCACIALDAEVATSEVHRIPHLRNAPSSVKALPEYDYHIVSLAKRSRSGAPDLTGGGRGKRLHFVRGHWRHLERHKAWIKWHVRGNPELGYIEKHYAM